VLLTTDSSLRRTIAKSRQKEYDFKLLGCTEAEHIVINKAEKISKQIVRTRVIVDMIFSPGDVSNMVELGSVSARH